MTIYSKPTLMMVQSRHNNHYWLEVIEGGDKGVRVSVPVCSRDYDDGLQRRIVNDIEVGDVREFVLVSDNDVSPNWRINEVGELHP